MRPDPGAQCALQGPGHRGVGASLTRTFHPFDLRGPPASWDLCRWIPVPQDTPPSAHRLSERPGSPVSSLPAFWPFPATQHPTPQPPVASPSRPQSQAVSAFTLPLKNRTTQVLGWDSNRSWVSVEKPLWQLE